MCISTAIVDDGDVLCVCVCVWVGADMPMVITVLNSYC